MTYDGALVMPKNAAVLTPDEMTYVEGGAVRLSVNPGMLLKSYCLGLGAVYAAAAGLSVFRVAIEIYAHARLYYWSISASLVNAVAKFVGISSSTATANINYIRTHSNPIDIGGDSAIRVAAYSAIWALF